MQSFRYVSHAIASLIVAVAHSGASAGTLGTYTSDKKGPD